MGNAGRAIDIVRFQNAEMLYKQIPLATFHAKMLSFSKAMITGILSIVLGGLVVRHKPVLTVLFGNLRVELFRTLRMEPMPIYVCSACMLFVIDISVPLHFWFIVYLEHLKLPYTEPDHSESKHGPL